MKIKAFASILAFFLPGLATPPVAQRPNSRAISQWQISVFI